MTQKNVIFIIWIYS